MALMPPPLISIMTPVYNGAEYLEELIQSVLNQGYPAIEHLIIDDGSQDDGATVAILKRYPHLRWWSRENKGQYLTMNEGLLEAKGEFICYVSADDLLMPGAVQSVFDFLSAHPELDGVFGLRGFVDPAGNLQAFPLPFQKAPMSFVLYFAHISHCSLYIKRSSLLRRKLLFDPSLKYVGDYEWTIRISQTGLKIGFMDRELSRVRVHPNQTSQKNVQASALERERVLKDHRINKLYYSILWTSYLLQVWLWKVAKAFRDDGIKGFVGLLARWRRYKSSI